MSIISHCKHVLFQFTTMQNVTYKHDFTKNTYRELDTSECLRGTADSEFLRADVSNSRVLLLEQLFKVFGTSGFLTLLDIEENIPLVI